MTTVFKAALGVCGLSQQEAADFLQVALPTIKDWSRGAAAPPLGVWRQLASLYDQIVAASEAALDTLEISQMDRRALNEISVMASGEMLPTEGAAAAAAAMFLLAEMSNP